MRKKIFRGPRAPPSRFQKLSFWSLSEEKYYFWVSISKNHHLRTFAGIAIDLRVVRPSRLLLRTTFLSKIISTTYNEAQRCVESFLEALGHHQLVLKNSLLEEFLRNSKEKWYIWVSFSKNHHCRTFTTIATDLRVVRPFRLLLRATFVPKSISNTNGEA